MPGTDVQTAGQAWSNVSPGKIKDGDFKVNLGPTVDFRPVQTSYSVCFCLLGYRRLLDEM